MESAPRTAAFVANDSSMRDNDGIDAWANSTRDQLTMTVFNEVHTSLEDTVDSQSDGSNDSSVTCWSDSDGFGNESLWTVWQQLRTHLNNLRRRQHRQSNADPCT